MDKPFYLEFLETLNARYPLPDKSNNKLWAMQSGFKGQVEFNAILQEVLPRDWHVLNDLNFDHSIGKIQIDTLLISPHAIYHFEVKNLVAQCEYRSGDFYNLAKGYKYQNYFAQTNRQNELLRPILAELKVDVPLVSKLIFINEEDTVIFHENMSDHYLKRWQIKPFIRRMAKQQAQLTQFRPINTEQVALALIGESVTEFAQDKYVEQDFVKDARQGIICHNCQASVGVDDIGRYAIQCANCGAYESKERAILRTICEFGLLHYDQELDSARINGFIGVEELKKSIQRQLRSHFTKDNVRKKHSYSNPAKSINKAFTNIHFYYD